MKKTFSLIFLIILFLVSCTPKESPFPEATSASGIEEAPAPEDVSHNPMNPRQSLKP